MPKLSTTKRRYTLMRQKIIQAAWQILQDQGTDGLSMRAIAQLVHTSPANLYEYFLNKEEIISSICNELLAGLSIHLQKVAITLPARTYLLTLCVQYIDFMEQKSSLAHLIGYPFQADTIDQRQETDRGVSSQPAMEPIANRQTDQQLKLVTTTDRSEATLATTDDQTNKHMIYQIFIQAVERCIEEGSIPPPVTLTANDITHIIGALVHGLVTVRVQNITTIDRKTMKCALESVLDGLSVDAAH